MICMNILFDILNIWLLRHNRRWILLYRYQRMWVRPPKCASIRFHWLYVERCIQAGILASRNSVYWHCGCTLWKHWQSHVPKISRGNLVENISAAMRWRAIIPKKFYLPLLVIGSIGLLTNLLTSFLIIFEKYYIKTYQ